MSESKKSKIKKFLSKMARKLLPVGAGLIVGTFAPPLSIIVSRYISSTLNRLGFEVDPNEIRDLSEDLIKKTSVNVISDKLEEILLKKEKKMVEEIKAVIEYVLRDYYRSLREAIDYLKENPQEILDQLALIGLSITELKEKIDEIKRIGKIRAEKILIEQKRMERKLDELYMRVVQLLTKEISAEKLRLLSRLQLQRIKLSSENENEYNPELYINRIQAESIFEDFRTELEFGFSKVYNTYLLLADAGLGKTWTMAHLATELVNDNEIVFFIPLRFGFKVQIESIFNRSLHEIVNIIDEIYDKARKPIYFFLDGLDEIGKEEIKNILRFILLLKNKKSVGFILSCRLSDWIYNAEIRARYGELKDVLFRGGSDPSIETPISAKLEEFSDEELEVAAMRYGIPSLAGELKELARKPYILSIIARWYWQNNRLPDLNRYEDYTKFLHMILNRMGIVGESREALFEIVDRIIELKEKEILMGDILRIIDTYTWSIIRSSGLVIMHSKPWGTTIELNPAIAKHLLILASKRKSKEKRTEYIKKILAIYPEYEEDFRKIGEISKLKTIKGKMAPKRTISEGVDQSKTITVAKTPADMLQEILSRSKVASVGILARELGISEEEVESLLELIDAVKSEREKFWIDTSYYREAIKEIEDMIARKGEVNIRGQAKQLKIFPEDIKKALKNRGYLIKDEHAFSLEKGVEKIVKENLSEKGKIDIMELSQEEGLPLEIVTKYAEEYGIKSLRDNWYYDKIKIKNVVKEIRKKLDSDGKISLEICEEFGILKEDAEALLEKMAERSPTSDNIFYKKGILEVAKSRIEQEIQSGPQSISALKQITKLTDNDLDYILSQIGLIRKGNLVYRIEQEEVIKFTVPYLRSKNPWIKRSGAIGLGIIFQGTQNSTVIEYMKSLFNDIDGWTRNAAVVSLGLISQRYSMKVLSEDTLQDLLDQMESLLKRNDPWLRRGAVLGLGIALKGTGNVTAIDLVKKSLSDRNLGVRINAILSLALISRGINYNVTRALGRLTKSEEPQIRHAAILSLAMIHKNSGSLDTIKAITESLYANDPMTRYISALALGLLINRKEETGKGFLIKLMNIKDRYLLSGAILGWSIVFQDSMSRFAFEQITKYREHNDPWIREAFTLGLGLIFHKSGDRTILKMIKEKLNDSNPDVRASAVLSLGLIFRETHRRDILDLIRPTLNDNAFNVRLISNLAVGLIFRGSNNFDIIDIIRAAVRDRNPKVRGFSILGQSLILAPSSNYVNLYIIGHSIGFWKHEWIPISI